MIQLKNPKTQQSQKDLNEVYELMMERDALENKGIESFNDNELDQYYLIKDRIKELLGGKENAQRTIESHLEKRFGRRFSS